MGLGLAALGRLEAGATRNGLVGGDSGGFVE